MPIISSQMASLGFTSIKSADPYAETLEEKVLDLVWIDKYDQSNLTSLSEVLGELDSLLSLSSSKTILEVLDEITAIGRQLFNTGAQIAKSHFDDRPLFHARLSAQLKLKRFISRLPVTADLSIAFLTISGRLESSSRNLDNIDFSAAPAGSKKFIVTGFDPYFNATNTRAGVEIPKAEKSNASGNIALRLHGETISNSGNIQATIQSCLVPTRWKDFDKGIIEAHLAEFIEDPSKRVDMILSLSLDSTMNQKIAVVERFATVARGMTGGHHDNNDLPNKVNQSVDLNKVVITTSFGDKPAWTQSTLPKDMIDNSSSFATVFTLGLRENYQSQFAGLVFISITYSANLTKKLDRDYSPSRLKESELLNRTHHLIQGSGGDFLSNEIFYRIALIRELNHSTKDQDTANMSTGHIHVPAIMPDDKTGSTNHIDSLTTLLRERLKACIVPTGYFQNKLLQ